MENILNKCEGKTNQITEYINLYLQEEIALPVSPSSILYSYAIFLAVHCSGSCWCIPIACSAFWRVIFPYGTAYKLNILHFTNNIKLICINLIKKHYETSKLHL